MSRSASSRPASARLLRRAERRLADGAGEIDVVLLGRRRILADQPRAQILHEADEPARDPFRSELAVAGDAVFRPDGAEVPRTVVA